MCVCSVHVVWEYDHLTLECVYSFAALTHKTVYKVKKKVWRDDDDKRDKRRANERKKG